MISEPECYFKCNRPSSSETEPRGVQTDLAGISCKGERLQVEEAVKGIKKNVNLHGFSSFIELVFFRANAEIISECDAFDKHICEAHLKFLLIDWPDTSKEQKKERKRQGQRESICVLPHQGCSPKENQKASKNNVLWWLTNFKQLINIGSSTAMMQDSSFTISQVEVQRRHQPARLLKEEPEDRDQEWDEFTPDYRDYESDGSLDSFFHDDSKRDAIRYHFNEIAKLVSTTSFSSETEWNLLAKETQRRKFNYNNNDGCAEQILNAVGERVTSARNRRERVEALATIVDIPFFSSYNVLLTIPGVTKYLIHQSRLFARGGLDLDVKYERVRFKEGAVLFFLTFVVRSNALISLPWIDNTATRSDGSKVDLASTVRTQTYARIIRQYQEETKAHGKPKEECVSAGTAFALLKAVVPKMSTRKTCVDEFACAAHEAWRQLNDMVQQAGNKGMMTHDEQTDLIRRIRLAKSFIECDLRNHIELSSTVIHHCANFALSDPGNRAYRSPCTHDHDEQCVDCMQMHRTISLIRDQFNKAYGSLTKLDQYDVDRWLELIGRCTKDLEAYVAHIIRGVVSDIAKQEVLENLKEGECLVTLDWAQKFLPTSAEEGQSSFYAKVGISLHVSHAATVIGGEKFHHSFVHTIDCCTQDSNSVSAISKHVLLELKNHGIEHVVLRSDNASCYKSAAIIGDFATLGNDLPTVSAIIYSESQLGKGPCDRTTSHCKRKVNEETNGLKNTRDAAEIFKALTEKDPIRGVSVYNCTIEKVDTESKKIPDVSSIYDVRFGNSAIIARKHTGIGTGLKTDGLKPLNATLTVDRGFLCNEKFWTSYGDNSTISSSQPDPSSRDDTADDQLLQHKNVFFCSTPGCSRVFTTVANLEIHELKGNHKIRQKKETLLDFAINQFSELVENEESARLKVANDCFNNISIDDEDHALKEGYGLKQIRNNPIGAAARSAAEEYFTKHRSMNPPRRACPRIFSQSMVDMRNLNGEYTFKVSELLSEKQAQGLFSRWEKRRKSGVSLANKNRKSVSKTVTSKSRKRKNDNDGNNRKQKRMYDDDDDDEEDDDNVVEDGVEDDHRNDDEEEEDELEFLMNAVMEERDKLFLP